MQYRERIDRMVRSTKLNQDSGPKLSLPSGRLALGTVPFAFVQRLSEAGSDSQFK